MKPKITVTGIKEIDEVLRGMPLELSDKVLQQAHAAAAKPLVQEAKYLAPQRSGNLIQSIGVIKKGFKNVQRGDREVGEVIVGPRQGGRFKGFHAHLIEYGTKKRELLGKGKYKKGTNRGAGKKRKFFYPAFFRTKNEVLGGIKVQIGRKLLSFMRKTLK